MSRNLRHIASVFMVVLYVASTSGFVVKVGICQCSNKMSVEFFSTTATARILCLHNDRKEGCCDHDTQLEPVTGCCKIDLKYFRYEPETNLVVSCRPALHLHAFYLPVTIRLIPETSEISNNISLTFESPPPERNCPTVIFLHQLVFSSEEPA